MKLRYLAIVLSTGWLAVGCAGDSDTEHVEDMAREHAEDTTEPNEMSEAAPSADVDTQQVDYATVNGESATGYLARPAGVEGPLPGIIVIHEWWGLNDNIRSMTDQLAAEGYQALAVDLYGGESADTPDGARALMQASTENEEALVENLKQAFAYLEGDGDGQKVGTIGWCFGGGWSLRTALALPERVDATVIYYGRLVTDEEELEPLTMPILGFFGAEDQGIPVESVREFEQALDSLGKDATIHVYEGAGHAFANPSGNNYEPEPAQDSWQKTLAFFEAHLKSTS